MDGKTTRRRPKAQSVSIPLPLSEVMAADLLVWAAASLSLSLSLSLSESRSESSGRPAAAAQASDEARGSQFRTARLAKRACCACGGTSEPGEPTSWDGDTLRRRRRRRRRWEGTC